MKIAMIAQVLEIIVLERQISNQEELSDEALEMRKTDTTLLVQVLTTMLLGKRRGLSTQYEPKLAIRVVV